LVADVLKIELEDERFDPSNFVSGPVKWSIERDWFSLEPL
jgi:hypothetical protein